VFGTGGDANSSLVGDANSSLMKNNVNSLEVRADPIEVADICLK